MLMLNPKRSSDDYIRLNKKITDRHIRNIIYTVAREWLMTNEQACYEIIRRFAIDEIKKREK